MPVPNIVKIWEDSSSEGAKSPGNGDVNHLASAVGVKKAGLCCMVAVELLV